MMKNNTVKLEKNAVWILLRMYHAQELKQNKLTADIERAVQNKRITYEDLKSRVLVFDSTMEGSDVQEYSLALQSIQHEKWFDKTRCFWLNNIFQNNVGARTHSIPFFLIDFAPRIPEKILKSVVKKYQFVCLLRNHRPSRTWIAKYILDRYDPTQYQISYRSNLTKPEFDFDINRTVPISIDRTFYHHQMLGVPGMPILESLIHLVAETSSQQDANDIDCWGSQFVTEKTFKAFDYKQLPLWFAVPNFVKNLRAVGFDLFDDWFEGHYYDSIENQTDRFLAVFKLLDNAMLKIKSLGGVESVSQMLDQRFQHNIDVLHRLSTQKQSDLEKFYQKIQFG